MSASVSVASDCPSIPWAVNVFALGDIGSAAQPYSSDFEGSAAAVGNAWYKGFSLNIAKDGTEPVPVNVAQYVGGNLHMVGGIIGFGGVEARGNIVLEDGATIAGNVQAGGNVTATGPSPGRIEGSLVLQGVHNPAVAAASVSQAQFQATLPLQQLASYYNSLSASLAKLPSTLQTTRDGGHLFIDAWGARAIGALTLPASELRELWGISISSPDHVDIVINVPDSHVAIESLVWAYSGGVRTGKAMLNAPNAATVTLQGGPHQVTILAPRATVTYPQGLLVGTIVVHNLLGSGQINFANVTNEVRCIVTPPPAPTAPAPLAAAAAPAEAASESANVSAPVMLLPESTEKPE